MIPLPLGSGSYGSHLRQTVEMYSRSYCRQTVEMYRRSHCRQTVEALRDFKKRLLASYCPSTAAKRSDEYGLLLHGLDFQF